MNETAFVFRRIYYAIVCGSVLAVLPPSLVQAQTATPKQDSLPSVHSVPPREASPEQSVAAALRADSRLQRKITLDETGITLEQLLQKLSSDQLVLKAQPECREQKLQIRLKQRSLSTLMQSLADLLDGGWQERGGKQGYTFFQRLRTARRRDEWWRLYTTEREKAMAQISGDMVRQMQRTVVARDPNSPEYQKEPGTPEREAEAARSHNAFGQLSGTLQERIARAFDATFTYDMDGLQGQIPHEGGVVVRVRDLPAEAQQIVMQQHVRVPVNADTLVQFSNTGFSVNSQLVWPGHMWPPAGLMLDGVRRSNSPAFAVCWINHKNLPQLVQALGKNATDGWQQLAAYAQSRVWSNDIGKAKQWRAWPTPLRSERLRWLGEKASIEYVSDYYTQWGRSENETERAEPLSRPLKDELDGLAQEQDISWKQANENVYLFRNNRWYRDDRLEVPEGYARTLLQRAEKLFGMQPLVVLPTGVRGVPPVPPDLLAAQLEVESDVVRTLTPWQIANGLKRFRVVEGLVPHDIAFGGNNASGEKGKQGKAQGPQRPPSPPRVWCPLEVFARVLQYHSRLLQFYGSLSQEQRMALIHGQLALETLSDTQQQQLAEFAPAVLATKPQSGAAATLLGIRGQLTGFRFSFAGNQTELFFVPDELEVYAVAPNTQIPTGLLQP